MVWPTTIISDGLFIPLYAIVGIFNVVNVVRHGRGKSVGFVSLLIFSTVHLVGNIMLVVEYNDHYASTEATIWGYILQSIGLSFLVSASIAFYTRAHALVREEQRTTARTAKLLNCINLAALICTIIGYTSVDLTDAQGRVVNPSLPIESKVGAVVYVVLVAAITALTLVGLNKADRGEARVIKHLLLVGLGLMIVRASYSVYATLKGGALMPNNVALKIALQYVAEFLALAAYTALGFCIDRRAEVQQKDVEELVSTTYAKDYS